MAKHRSLPCDRQPGPAYALSAAEDPDLPAQLQYYAQFDRNLARVADGVRVLRVWTG
jgi:hypothetical protein